MKALSILQPWAWLIVNGHKNIENRKWRTAYRGPVLIHAGKTYGKIDYEADVEHYRRKFGQLPPREEMIGGIVGIATIVDCVSHSESEWFNGPYGFVLRDAKPLPFRPYKGQLGFFEVVE